MAIDPAVAVGADLGEQTFAWAVDDVLLYHLALGAGHDPTDAAELGYVTDGPALGVLPSFGLLAPTFRLFDPPTLSLPGVEVDLTDVLYGGQELVVHRPLPARCRARVCARIARVYDKKSAAVVVVEADASGEDGGPLFSARATLFARGQGGFDGERGPSARPGPAPSARPDLDVDVPTLPQQALWYRLCGDRNPLHSDPAFARAAGYPRPVLHGLCTYGMTLKALVDGLLGGDTDEVGGFRARFSGVVYPGETLRVRAWRRAGEWDVATTVRERDAPPALADGVLVTAR